jgi:hypothetical protein
VNAPEGGAYPDVRLEIFPPVLLGRPVRMKPLRVLPELVRDQKALASSLTGFHRGPVVGLQLREHAPVASGKTGEIGCLHHVDYLPPSSTSPALVAGRAEALLVDSGDIVPCGYEELLSATAQVFVQLELQCASPRGTST